MKCQSALAAVLTAAIAVLLLTTAAVTAAAAGPTKTATVTVALRVSHGCQVTITGKWSNLSQSATEAVDTLYYDNNPNVSQSTTSVSGTRGSYKAVWQGVSSTVLHTLGAGFMVDDSIDGWVPTSPNLDQDDAYCAGPFTPVTG